MYPSVLWLVMWVPCRLLMKCKPCCDFSPVLPARSGHVHHTGYVGKYRAGRIYYRHRGCAARDHLWFLYRGFLVLMCVGIWACCFSKLESKSQKEESERAKAQTPRRAVKICFLPLPLLACRAALEGTQKTMLEGKTGRAQLLSGNQQQDKEAVVSRVMLRR